LLLFQLERIGLLALGHLSNMAFISTLCRDSIRMITRTNSSSTSAGVLMLLLDGKKANELRPTVANRAAAAQQVHTMHTRDDDDTGRD
jgi:hypothetical protein